MCPNLKKDFGMCIQMNLWLNFADYIDLYGRTRQSNIKFDKWMQIKKNLTKNSL